MNSSNLTVFEIKDFLCSYIWKTHASLLYKGTVFETSQIRVWLRHAGVEIPHWLSSTCFPVTTLNPLYLCTVIFEATIFAFIVLLLGQLAETNSFSRELENENASNSAEINYFICKYEV